MTRPRSVPRLAATLWVALICARARAAEPSSQQAVDAETPRLKGPKARRDTVPSPTDQESEAPAPRRDTAIYFTFGLGTPEGLSGFEAVDRFGDSLELAAGLGAGFAAILAGPPANPLQWSVMPRLRLGDDHDAFTLGAGLSGGQYATDPTYYTIWANFEIGSEHWSRGGFAFRYYLGFAHGMMLGSQSSADRPVPDIPYLGIGLGYAF